MKDLSKQLSVSDLIETIFGGNESKYRDCVEGLTKLGFHVFPNYSLIKTFIDSEWKN